MEEGQALLHVSGSVHYAGVGARGYPHGIASVAGIQAYVDLVVMEITATGEQAVYRSEAMRTEVLRIGALLQA